MSAIFNTGEASDSIFCDIGVNLLDDVYKGFYNGKRFHAVDINTVLDRARIGGVARLIITAGSIEESREALPLIEEWQQYSLYSTAGIHPTRCGVFANDITLLMTDLSDIIEHGIRTGKVIAIGECGLDYDRLHFCGKELQMVGFRAQMTLADKFGLPMFLHNRNTSGDFLSEVREHRHLIRGGGVVHSFDSNVEEMRALCDLGFYIGINGCSLKTEENLDVVREIPTDRILLETDAPWCSIKASHAGAKYIKTEYNYRKKEKYSNECLVKDRNEPCKIKQVLEVIAAIKNIDEIVLAKQIYRNTEKLFFSKDLIQT